MKVIRESCREWDADDFDRCGKRAEVLLWGKLFPPEALGPRCRTHAENHLGQGTIEDALRQNWAILDLRNIVSLDEKEIEVLSGIGDTLYHYH